jgi:hypothetical protein
LGEYLRAKKIMVPKSIIGEMYKWRIYL